MEALERRGKLVAVAAIVFIVFWSQCKGVEGQKNSTLLSYVCPPNYIRLGHSCYFFSETKMPWQEALFSCSENAGNLTVPARWEDRNLRSYLNKLEAGTPGAKEIRWIGGIYDSKAKAWRWGDDLRKMNYQSFSKMKKMKPQDLAWHCIAMMPELLYRWSPRLCTEQHQFICKAKLRKVTKDKASVLRRRWQRMGTMNEIIAPPHSTEVKDPMINDVTANPFDNPKSYDVRPNPHGMRRHGPRRPTLKKRRPAVRRRLKRPFPGYTWNRRDPEGSFLRNAELLRSGKIGLTPQQVKTHLARLQHLRDKQIARRRRLQEKDDWLENDTRPVLAKAHARTYTVDNNISALHPKMIVEEFDMFPPPPPQPVTAPKPGAG